MYKDYSETEQHYYGCITAMDQQIGRFRAELRRLGIAENTMVWFCSDNGPEGRTDKGEPSWCKYSRGVTAGLRGRKRSLFEGGILGPALLEWPGHIEPDQVTDFPCSTLDYLPTIQDLLGYEMPDERPIDGISLMPLINGKAEKRSAPIPFWFIKPSKEAMHNSPTLAVIDNNYKLLTNLSKDGREDMLFDLAKDPYEKNNIIADHPKIAIRLRSWIMQWTDSCRKSHSGEDYPTPFTPVNSFPPITGTWRK
jgi:arylsulfatase A-like enzyme